MFNQYNELSNYMTYDSSSLNQYNYKNLDDVFPVYQQYQNLYYFKKQINPITLANVNAQSRDPSHPTNLPCDIRPTIYDGIDGVYGHNSMNDITHLQTRFNNPNNWRDNIPSQHGFHNQNEHTLNNKRPISSIQAGQASSNQDVHGYLLF